MNKIDLKQPAAYDADFALWSEEQAALLRAGKLDRIDLENIAEEIESLGRSGRYEIDSRMEVLLQHLLKWEFQPEKRSNGWKASIDQQRIKIARVIKNSPSLRAYPAENIDDNYILGKNGAITDTNLPESVFPEACRYSAAQALDREFYPGPSEPWPGR